MAITPSNLGSSFSIPGILAERSSELSTHERTQWDATDFKNWFEAAGRRLSISDAPSGCDVEKHVQTEASTMMEEASPVAIPKSAVSSVKVDFALASSATAIVTLGNKAELNIIGSVAPPTAPFRDPLLEGSDTTDMAGNACARQNPPTENDEGTGARVTVALSGNEASVWIQNSQLGAPAIASLHDLIDREISWSGLALAGLKINGRELVKAPVYRVVRATSGIDSSGG